MDMRVEKWNMLREILQDRKSKGDKDIPIDGILYVMDMYDRFQTEDEAWQEHCLEVFENQ